MVYNIIQQFVTQLTTLTSILQKASAHAEARKFNADNFLALRLAPDMFPLVRQVQVACDTAKAVAGTLGQKDIPRFADDEATMAALLERIKKTLAYLGQFKEADFAATGADDIVPVPAQTPKFMRAHEALFTRALPNFYFHTVTTYAIIRHAGVDVGKMDYLGALRYVDKRS